MKRRQFVFILILGLLIFRAPCPAGAASEQAKPLDIKPLEEAIAKQIEAGNLVGLSVGLFQDGRAVLNKGFGRASLAPAVAATAETPFAIGSITKQFTSACILLLAEEGKLNIKNPVSRYYPKLTRAGDVTVLDLMNHVSGYPDYYPLDFVDRRMLKPTTPDELIGAYAGGRLDFEPGSRYSYSNTAFVILGRVVEKVSGKPYGRFLKERILDPVGMKHTFFEPDPGGPELAKGYTTFAAGGPEPATPEAKGWIAAAGALYSTAADLAAWDLALISGHVLKPESLAIMTSPRTLADGRISSYGCGLSIGTRNGRAIYTHNGAVSGFYAFNTVIPSLRAAVVCLSNYDNSTAVSDIFGRLVAAMLAADVPYVPEIMGPTAVEAQKAMLKAYQDGRVDRNLLGAEFNWFLTAEKLRAASGTLKPYGEPTRVELASVAERGGMEVSNVRFFFPSDRGLRGLMYRTPDGKVQQFFVYKN